MRKIPQSYPLDNTPDYCRNCDRDYRKQDLLWRSGPVYTTCSDPMSGDLMAAQRDPGGAPCCSRECAEAYEYSAEWTGPMEG